MKRKKHLSEQIEKIFECWALWSEAKSADTKEFFIFPERVLETVLRRSFVIRSWLLFINFQGIIISDHNTWLIDLSLYLLLKLSQYSVQLSCESSILVHFIQFRRQKLFQNQPFVADLTVSFCLNVDHFVFSSCHISF